MCTPFSKGVYQLIHPIDDAIYSNDAYLTNNMLDKNGYHQTSNIGHTLGNKIADYYDVVGASPVGDIFIPDFTPVLNGLDKENC